MNNNYQKIREERRRNKIVKWVERSAIFITMAIMGALFFISCTSMPHIGPIVTGSQEQEEEKCQAKDADKVDGKHWIFIPPYGCVPSDSPQGPPPVTPPPPSFPKPPPASPALGISIAWRTK